MVRPQRSAQDVDASLGAQIYEIESVASRLRPRGCEEPQRVRAQVLRAGHAIHKAQEPLEDGTLALLQESAADLAHAHDDDWVPLLEQGDDVIEHLAVEHVRLLPPRSCSESRDGDGDVEEPADIPLRRLIADLGSVYVRMEDP